MNGRMSYSNHLKHLTIALHRFLVSITKCRECLSINVSFNVIFESDKCEHFMFHNQILFFSWFISFVIGINTLKQTDIALVIFVVGYKIQYKLNENLQLNLRDQTTP